MADEEAQFADEQEQEEQQQDEQEQGQFDEQAGDGDGDESGQFPDERQFDEGDDEGGYDDGAALGALSAEEEEELLARAEAALGRPLTAEEAEQVLREMEEARMAEAEAAAAEQGAYDDEDGQELQQDESAFDDSRQQLDGDGEEVPLDQTDEQAEDEAQLQQLQQRQQEDEEDEEDDERLAAEEAELRQAQLAAELQAEDQQGSLRDDADLPDDEDAAAAAQMAAAEEEEQPPSAGLGSDAAGELDQHHDEEDDTVAATSPLMRSEPPSGASFSVETDRSAQLSDRVELSAAARAAGQKGVTFSEVSSAISAPGSIEPSPATSKRASSVMPADQPQPVAAFMASYAQQQPSSVAGVPSPSMPSPAVARSPVPRGGVVAPPLPGVELDQLQRMFMGLKVLSAGKVDPSAEGVEGKHWVRSEDLPTHSASMCEKWAPWQRKRICFEMNKENIITWVRYNNP